MVREQIEARGVRDPRVLAALRHVRREQFVPDPTLAYEDRPVPIGDGQTISQPYIVALMAEALELGSGDRVLEVGTGSGYGAAVLAELAAEVLTVERNPRLAAAAEARLKRLGYENVRVLIGDGSLGWPAHAPYDAIIVTAAGPEIPPSLRGQLEVGARLVMPVGGRHRDQRLIRMRRRGEHEFERESLGAVAFVPLLGEEGWHAAEG
jgi:protein-L-isoaspartate(D-aspartate) O-methyltransferase